MAFLCFLALVVAVDTRAAENLIINKYLNAYEIPQAFLELGKGQEMMQKIYKDDSDNDRSDKVYYTTTHTYNSFYPLTEISRTLNPINGRLDTLFKDTIVKRTNTSGIFNVLMEISTTLKNFDCESNLSFKSETKLNKKIFTYSFTNFNMVFTDVVIQIELEEMGSVVKVKLSQIAALKGSTYEKLSRFFAIGKFESAMKLNIKALQHGIGGK